MNIKIEKGNLFDVDLKKYALAHCISLDCAMGAGIAKEFDKRCPYMKKELIKTIKENKLVYPFTIGYYNNGKIYNLITKEKYWYKPTYETLTICLDHLASLCGKDDVKYLAMPLIGCGLDRLQWNKVEKIIIEKFNNLDIEILIRYI